MTKYQIEKEKIKQEAIEWQQNFNERDYSWNEFCLKQDRFEKLAKRFGLIREFKENGII